MNIRFKGLLTTVLAAAMLLAGCGDSGSSSSDNNPSNPADIPDTPSFNVSGCEATTDATIASQLETAKGNIADILKSLGEGELVAHELFHCLSRLYPEYRQAMYSLVDFTVLDQDIEVPEEIRDRIIANPDVEHHNSYATFTIGGEKKDCYLVFLTDNVFEQVGDTFFDGMYSGVVPLDGSGVYRVDEVDDFWDVVGRNTDYVEDPEELMATNFAYAILYLDEGYGAFASPEILEGIVEHLKSSEW